MSETNSEYAITTRRKEVAAKYFAGITPMQLWQWYGKQYGLSKKSLEADITLIRSEFVPEDFSEIWKDELVEYYALRDRAKQEGDIKQEMEVARIIQNHLKLINPNKKASIGTVNINQNNISVPDMTIDDIKKLLGRSDDKPDNDSNGTVDIIPLDSE